MTDILLLLFGVLLPKGFNYYPQEA